MQDDCYLIADAGWKAGAQPREIRQVKNKENKLFWPEKEDFKKGKRRFKSDLVPATLLIARYFATERDAIASVEAELAGSCCPRPRARRGCSRGLRRTCLAPADAADCSRRRWRTTAAS